MHDLGNSGAATAVLPAENGTVSAPSPELRALIDDARTYCEAAKAASTLRAYRTDWRAFSTWCDENRLQALPAAPETVALYLAALAGVKAPATIQRRLTAISQAHKTAGLETPTTAQIVRTTWRGIRRTFGTASASKAPVRTKEVRAMVGTLGDRTIDARNRAVILLGFAGAFRRSEIVSLDVEDLEFNADGLVVTLRRSKTDQDGRGEQVGIPYGSDPSTCPVRAVRAWMEAAGLVSGPVFRSINRHGTVSDRRLPDRVVAELVKACAERVGIDPASVAAHSLRSGLITSAAEADVAERDIMRHSRHKSVIVMRTYIKRAGLFQSNAAAAVGL